MLYKVKAFLFSSVKYGEDSLILNCFTDNLGYKTFILKKAFLKKNKKSYCLLPLNEVEISFFHRNREIEVIKEIYSTSLFSNVYTQITKISILTFLSEILAQVLKGEINENLYLFIKKQLIIFEKKDKYYSNFHLYFLFHLIKLLGFNPIYSNFPLIISKLWEQLLIYDFENDRRTYFFKKEREVLLEELLKYYSEHLENFRKPKSLEILKIVFN